MKNLNWEDHDLFIASPNDQLGISAFYGLQEYLKGHVLIQSSGTGGAPKWVCIKKEAILCAAHEVNKNIQVQKHDIWCQALPYYHIGGLAIYARAHLSESLVVDWRSKNPKWDAENFYSVLSSSGATFTSLVPTQIYDLCNLNLKAPEKLKAVLVGGAALSEGLYLKAKSLHWPLLPGYGMTETSAQIASADLNSLVINEFPGIKILPHVQVKTNSEGLLLVKSEALFSFYLDEKLNIQKVITNGWFETQDLVELKGSFLVPKGRKYDQIKIAGELVSKSNLERIFHNISLHNIDYAIQFVQDERLGFAPIMLVAKKSDQYMAKQVFIKFNEQVRPFEKLREIKVVDKILRTELGKMIIS